ncbi:MAG: GatB/YqeY domain-containing protein [bacterium]
MSLIDKLDQDINEALKGGERDKLTVLRGLKSVLKYARIEKGEDLTGDDVITALSSEAKKVRDSIEQFGKGGRQDLVDKSQVELEIIQSYLPKQLSEDELREIVKAAVTEVGAESAKDMGKIMKVVMPKIKGQADGKMVNKLAMEILAK